MTTTSTPVTNTRFIEEAFMHAMDAYLTDETKAAAKELACKLSSGEAPKKSPLVLIMEGFIMGLNEGLAKNK